MSAIFSKAGFRGMRTSWILLALSIAATAGLGFAGHWYLQKEKRDGTKASSELVDARSRLEAIRRERDSLAESSEVFRSLVARGILEEERRLDTVERVADLRNRFGILSLDYEIFPQRRLPGASFGAVDILASRVKFKMRVVHEGDALGALDALEHSTRGITPVDRCTLRRIEESGPAAQSARVEAECQLEWITLKEKPRG